jgi:hypothetical protein
VSNELKTSVIRVRHPTADCSIFVVSWCSTLDICISSEDSEKVASGVE